MKGLEAGWVLQTFAHGPHMDSIEGHLCMVLPGAVHAPRAESSKLRTRLGSISSLSHVEDYGMKLTTRPLCAFAQLETSAKSPGQLGCYLHGEATALALEVTVQGRDRQADK